MNERHEIIWEEIKLKCQEEGVSVFYLEMLEIDINWIWHYIYINDKEFNSTIDPIIYDDLYEICKARLIKLIEHKETIEQFKTDRYYYQIINI